MDDNPFLLCKPGERRPKLRPLTTLEGLGDRMRTAAFAEYQAIEAFRWAADRFEDVPRQLRDDWRAQVREEIKHHELICARMKELGIGLRDRPVSSRLSESLKECSSGKEFCLKMAGAEERGRQAAIRLIEALADRDPVTAAIFQEIADDEVAHVALAKTYFGWSPEE